MASNFSFAKHAPSRGFAFRGGSSGQSSSPSDASGTASSDEVTMTGVGTTAARLSAERRSQGQVTTPAGSAFAFRARSGASTATASSLIPSSTGTPPSDSVSAPVSSSISSASVQPVHSGAAASFSSRRATSFNRSSFVDTFAFLTYGMTTDSSVSSLNSSMQTSASSPLSTTAAAASSASAFRFGSAPGQSNSAYSHSSSAGAVPAGSMGPPANRVQSISSTAVAAASKKGQPAPSAILVSERQRGNPLLQYFRNVSWEFADIIPDYQMGEQTCALFLSLKYSMVYPKYLNARMNSVKTAYRTRVLLCYVDMEDPAGPLELVTKAAFINNWSLICAWSSEEMARYLETFKAFENKGADSLMGERVEEGDVKAHFGKALLKIKSVNKTDVATLAGTFGSLKALANASMQELAMCPGLGEKKVKRIFDAFHQPFLPTRIRSKSGSATVSAGSSSAAAGQAAAMARAAKPRAAAVVPFESLLDDADDMIDD